MTIIKSKSTSPLFCVHQTGRCEENRPIKSDLNRQRFNLNNGASYISEASLGWGGQEQRVTAELIGFRQHGCSVSLIAHPQSQIFERARAAGINSHACTFERSLLPLDCLRYFARQAG